MKNQTTPYLTFNGNAKEALNYYKKVFEGEVLSMQTFGEADYPTPPEAEDRIIHAQFKKDALFFMVSDTFPNQHVETGNHISLVLDFESEAGIQKVYDALQQESTVLMKLQDTFWGAKYAKVKDRFGVIWDLNYTKD
ncbi:VOC family protein [Oceanobacillus neutriphilus]|uniref:VOC family protein n=1 Tax=Oceanobacillus neutriphilus TaxID=531815 RepID=A0ABQ2P1W5_9BACI|nr:VOC family protein [Oceanobacillus neutriphilus]GGP15974.1 VOC family protein [Oceanobacillus neutriphilus]